MEGKKETRSVTRPMSVEVPVEELRATADAMERGPLYTADCLVPEGERKENCHNTETIRYPDREVKLHCQNKGTHSYVGYWGVVTYCEDCARREGQREAAEFRRKYSL